MTAPPPPVVLVTGATGGIGAAVAGAYARRGSPLVLLARSKGLLEQLGAECTARGVPVLVTVADVSDAGAVEAAFEAAVQRFGRVDVVVHTAAVAAYGRIEEVPAEVWDRVQLVNVGGTVNVARAALRSFAARAATGDGGGSLVLTGSILGQATVPFMGPYVTSKWAVRGFARVLQQEARELPGVHVGIVNPGAIRTPIYDLAANYAGRVGRPPPPTYAPERVASAILRLVDEHGRATGVGVTNPLIRTAWTVVPRLYDVLVPRLMRVAGLRRQSIEPHPGNVFTPSEDVPPLPVP